MAKLRILILEDSTEEAELAVRELLQAGLALEWRRAEDADNYRRELHEFSPDLILADYAMPGFNAMKALGILREMGREVPFILVTGSQSEEAAAAVMREGADDYVLKSDLMRLPSAVRHTLERWETKRALRESEERWHFALEGAGDSVWEWNPQTGAAYFSPQWKAMLGYQEEEIAASVSTWEQLVHPEDRGEAMARMDAHLEGRSPEYCSEYRLLCKDGSYKWTFSRGKVIRRDAGGAPLRVIGTQSDITERKRAEEALRRNKEFLSSVLEHAPVSIYVTDIEGRIRLVNRRWEADTGKQRAESLGQPLDRVLSAETARMLLSENQKVIEAGFSLAFEEVAEAPIEPHHFFTVKFPVRDATGRIEAVGGISLDITERKRAEEALRESEAKFRAMVETVPLAIVLARGIEQITEYVNPTFVKLFGYTLEDIPAIEQWWPLAYPDETYRKQISEDWVKAIKRAIETQAPIEPVEVVVTCKDGSKKNILWDYITLGDRNYSCGLDLTERKRAEEALRASEERYRSLAETSPDLIFIIDEHDKVDYVNQAAARLLGKPVEEIIGGPRAVLFPAETSESQGRHLAEAFAGNPGDPIWLESSLRHETGEIWQSVYLVPLQGRSGEGRRVLGVSRDITDRKQAEATLQERDLRFKKLSSQVPGLIYQFMMRPDGTFCVPFATEAIKDIFNCSPQDVREDFSPIAKAIFPEDLGRVVSSIRYSAEHLTPWHCEYRVQIPGQPMRWMLGQSTPEKLADGSVIWHGFNADVTDRKRLEEDSTRARTDFLFAVSHELKTPLFLMSAAQELLESLPPEQRAGRFLEYGEIWNRNLHRLRHLIENLVDSQRTEGMGLKITLIPTDLGKILEQTLHDVALLARRQRISFRQKLDSLPLIPADPESIHRLCENLLTNAIKFSHAGGVVEVSLQREGEEALFTVRDFGPGIPTAEIPRLFQPFQRTVSVDRAVIPGTGLGLYTAKQIVTAHGGSIVLESDLGKGTTVVVRLPLRPYFDNGTADA